MAGEHEESDTHLRARVDIAAALQPRQHGLLLALHRGSTDVVREHVLLNPGVSSASATLIVAKQSDHPGVVAKLLAGRHRLCTGLRGEHSRETLFADDIRACAGAQEAPHDRSVPSECGVHRRCHARVVLEVHRGSSGEQEHHHPLAAPEGRRHEQRPHHLRLVASVHVATLVQPRGDCSLLAIRSRIDDGLG
eukprot:7286287-Prymnesium_polylepis.1